MAIARAVAVIDSGDLAGLLGLQKIDTNMGAAAVDSLCLKAWGDVFDRLNDRFGDDFINLTNTGQLERFVALEVAARFAETKQCGFGPEQAAGFRAELEKRFSDFTPVYAGRATQIEPAYPSVGNVDRKPAYTRDELRGRFAGGA